MKRITDRGGMNRWLGMALILIVGLIHLPTAADQFGDARYKGFLFLAAAAGAALTALGIWQKAPFAWLLGGLVSGGALVGYFWSRTIGLPGLPVDPNLFEPIGVVSVVAEALFLVLAWARLSQHGVVAERAEQARAA